MINAQCRIDILITYIEIVSGKLGEVYCANIASLEKQLRLRGWRVSASWRPN